MGPRLGSTRNCDSRGCWGVCSMCDRCVCNDAATTQNSATQHDLFIHSWQHTDLHSSALVSLRDGYFPFNPMADNSSGSMRPSKNTRR